MPWAPAWAARPHTDDGGEFFAQLATHWKKNYSGWTAWMLTPDLKLPSKMRLKESRRVPMWNGPIECRMFRFDMVRAPCANARTRPRAAGHSMQVELHLPAEGVPGEPARPVVVDTNVALDLLIFSDPRTAPLRTLLARGAWTGLPRRSCATNWSGCWPTRTSFRAWTSTAWMRRRCWPLLTQQARLVDIAPRVAYVCRTRTTKVHRPGCAHRAILLSKGQGRDLHAQAPLTLDAHVATALVLDESLAAAAA